MNFIQIIVLLPVFLIFDVVSGARRCRYVGLDLAQGHDISRTDGVDSAMDCCKMCLNHPSCKGFAHNKHKECYFKYNSLPLMPDNTYRDTTSGIIEDFEDQPLAKGTEPSCWNIGRTNVDPGHDLVVFSAIFTYDECCQQCKANQYCKAFVHNTANMCWLKYNSAPLIASTSGFHSGIIQVTKVKMIEPIPAEPEQEWPEGGVLVKDKAHCIKLCSRGPVCTEWVYHDLTPTPACVLSYGDYQN